MNQSSASSELVPITWSREFSLGYENGYEDGRKDYTRRGNHLMYSIMAIFLCAWSIKELIALNNTDPRSWGNDVLMICGIVTGGGAIYGLWVALFGPFDQKKID